MKGSLPLPLALTLRVHHAVARLIVLLVALLLTLMANGLFPSALQQWETRLGETAWSLWPESRPEERVVIVAIDETSLSELGSWPWPRTTLATLAERLEEEGTALQLYDIVLPEPRPGDDKLANVLGKVPAILSQVPQLIPEGSLRSGYLSDSLGSLRCQPPMPSATGYLGNNAAFDHVAKGHITPSIDKDGVMRHQAPLICQDGRVYPSLALRGLLYAAYQQETAADAVQVTRGQGLFEPSWRLTLPALGVEIPLNAQGAMRLSYHVSPRVFSVISASDVLNGRVPDGWLDNAWVLVGATAFGLGDHLPSPHAAMTPGVELQARLLTSLLDQQVPHTPRMNGLLHAIAFITIATLLFYLSSSPGRVSYLGLPIAAFSLPLLLLFTHYAALLHAHLWLGWLLPAVFAALASALLLLLEYGRVRLERLRLYSNLSSYLPEQVAQEIAYHQPSGVIEARRQALVVLCADLRNYTALQDALSPEEAAAILHCFFVTATNLIEANGGSVHEFKGDSLLAIWPQHNSGAEQALNAAKQLVQEVPKRLPQQLPAGIEPLGIGVGVEQGDALVGSIGPAHRRHHSLMGKPVSLALRIQAITAELAQPVLVGESAAQSLSTPLEDQGAFLLEGITQPQRIYALMPEERPDTEVQDTPLLHLVKS